MERCLLQPDCVPMDHHTTALFPPLAGMFDVCMTCWHPLLTLKETPASQNEVCKNLLHCDLPCSWHCLLHADLALFLPGLLKCHIMGIIHIFSISFALLSPKELAGEEVEPIGCVFLHAAF